MREYSEIIGDAVSRARNIKPGFFKNDLLAECSALARILFAGLWCEADREGRLEDRPKRIKADVLPYDDCDVDVLLNELASRGFVTRYCSNGVAYLCIPGFCKHQNPHMKESASSIPAPDKHSASTVQATNHTGTSHADSLLLIPDSPSPEKHKHAQQSARFDEFWSAYPVKKGKSEALKTWKRKGLDAIADTILADVRNRMERDGDWLRGFTPHGSTYINGDGWQDGLAPMKPNSRPQDAESPRGAAARPL